MEVGDAHAAAFNLRAASSVPLATLTPPTMRPLVALAALALFLPAAPVRAQGGAYDTDAEWLDRCRRERDWGGGERGRACEVRDVPVPASIRSLVVDGNRNGSIRVFGRDGGGVKVTARLEARDRTDEDAEALLARVRVAADGRRVRADGPSPDGGERGWYVSYVIEVPRRFDLDLETYNGSVGVSGVTGTFDLRATNGSVALVGVGGDVRAHTQNGSLNVELTGRRWEGAGLDADTRNGSVRVRVPADYSARLETSTVNGAIRTEFPVTLSGRIGRELTIPLGEGGTPIRLRTTNGSVVILRS